MKPSTWIPITICVVVTVGLYRKHIGKKAKEWDTLESWTDRPGYTTYSKKHKRDRKTSAILKIIFFWTVGLWFLRACTSTLLD